MHLMQSAPGPETTIDGRRYLYFCGTSYLGLHGHANLIRAACEAMHQYGLGTATTRAGVGNAPPTVAVEELAARFWDCESAFYFASGYLGNQIALSVLAEIARVVFLDEHSHYSVVDACRYFDLPVYRFAHRDAQALSDALNKHVRPGQVPLVMSDGVFAASGSIAPVTDYIDALRSYEGAMLCLDDCHAFGVLGERGRGTYEYHGIAPQGVNELPNRSCPLYTPRLFAVGTLSKAFGGHGGIICGTRSFIESAKSSSHYYRGASAPPIPAAAACAAALRLVTDAPELIAQAQQNALLLKEGLHGLGLDVDQTPVPIVGLTLGNAQNMQRIQRELAGEGFLIAYSDQYSGLSECGALRIATFAIHTSEMIQGLVDSIGRHA
jgi:7-keto-8-aminopelargonate synthetase-like enzyme